MFDVNNSIPDYIIRLLPLNASKKTKHERIQKHKRLDKKQRLIH